MLKRVLNEKLSSYAFYAQYFQNEQGCRVQKLARKSIFELAANSSAVCGEIMKKNAPYGGGEFCLAGFNPAVVRHLHQRIAKQPRRIIGAAQPELNLFAVQMVSQSQ